MGEHVGQRAWSVWSEGHAPKGEGQQGPAMAKGQKAARPTVSQAFNQLPKGSDQPDWPTGTQVWPGKGHEVTQGRGEGVVFLLTNLISFILYACLQHFHYIIVHSNNDTFII